MAKEIKKKSTKKPTAMRKKAGKKFKLHWTTILSWCFAGVSLGVAVYFGLDSQRIQKDLKVAQEGLLEAQRETRKVSDSLRLVQEEGKKQMLEFYAMVDQILDTTTSYKTRRALNEMKRSIPKNYIGLISDIELAADSVVRLKEQEGHAESKLVDALSYTYPSVETPLCADNVFLPKLDHYLLEVLTPRSCSLFYSKREGAEVVIKNIIDLSEIKSIEVFLIQRKDSHNISYGLYRFPVSGVYSKLRLPPIQWIDTCYALVGLYLKSDTTREEGLTFYCKDLVVIPIK